MISRKLMHAAVQRLQVILSLIDMSEDEDDAGRRATLKRVRQSIRALTDMLNSHVKDEKKAKNGSGK